MNDRRDELIALFSELVELTILEEKDPQSFRVRAYENARQSIGAIARDVSAMTAAELAKENGIGKSTAQKIREFYDTGTIAKVDELRKKFPPGIVEVSRLPGIGPKSVDKLRNLLGIESVDDLAKAVREQKLRDMAGFGQKTEEKIARALERLSLDKAGPKRTPIAKALPLAERIVAKLRAVPGVERVEYAGSLRRFSETIGDVDILVTTREPAAVIERFIGLGEEVLASGQTKASIVTRERIQVDLRVVSDEAFGAAMLYFTGSKSHNIKLRQRAMDRGLMLNEYALTRLDTGEVVAARTEDEIYRALELEPIPPTLREDSGEIEASAERSLPPLVDARALRGDCHVHTTLSGDGKSSLDEIVARAIEKDHLYLAITDHAENLQGVGVSREVLRAQRDDLKRVGDAHPELTLLQGVELNIAPDGSLDYDLDFRMSLDFCVAAVHAAFDLDQATQTKRMLAAMDDPSVHAIGHLTGRKIGRRPGIDLDFVAILERAAELEIAIEINSALPRLDAPAAVLRRAREIPVLFVISSDAHHTRELDQLRWGALQSQRGWVSPDRVVNTWPKERFLAWVERRRARAA
jgi:DNA polymerase (family 10)